MIKRNHYLEKIIQYKETSFIKVLTGLRRVGKSVILEQLVQDYLDKGVNESHILLMNFELPQFFNIKNYLDLTEVVLAWAKGKAGTLYLFLDEVGRIQEWEKAVNGFHALKQFDIVITGSNADLLSSDLSTYLAGRYVEFLIHPFSFKEFKEVFTHSTIQDYLTFGGIPSIYIFNLEYNSTMNALRDIYSSAVFQDVVARHNIRNAVILEKLIQYLFANTSKTFSALSISNYLASQRINTSVDTILHYLKLLSDAFLIYKVPRQDVIGKSIFKTEEKYYIADLGFREAIVGGNTQSIELILENLVFIELKRRGYSITVGKINQFEIDFVAKSHNELIYIQVCYLMSLESTREREFRSLEMIQDNYRKYVVSMDSVDFSRNGIQHLSIEAFLLSEVF